MSTKLAGWKEKSQQDHESEWLQKYDSTIRWQMNEKKATWSMVRKASVQIGKDSASLWVCAGGMKRSFPKDIPSVGVGWWTCLTWSETSLQYLPDFSLGSGDWEEHSTWLAIFIICTLIKMFSHPSYIQCCEKGPPPPEFLSFCLRAAFFSHL